MNAPSLSNIRTACIPGWIPLLLTIALSHPSSAGTLRILPMGDSITAGYTDNTSNSANGSGGWNVPFEFGYRRQLYQLLTHAGYDFLFVGQSAEPFNFLETGYGDPTKGGTISPTFDLRTTMPPQNGHRGYGGIRPYQLDAALDTGSYIENDDPDIILLMVGINGITDQVVNGRPPSTGQLDALVTRIFTRKPAVHLIVAEITPYGQSTVEPYATRNPIIVGYNTYIRDVLVPKFQGQGRSISRVNQHKHFLSDPNNPSSATLTSLYSNLINHPTNAAYDTMAQTWFEGLLTVTPPTLPVLDQTVISPSVPAGGRIGGFSQPPPPSTETQAFTFVAGNGDTDNAKFTIIGSELRKSGHDFNADPQGTTYSIRVRATTNPGGLTGERVFTLSIAFDSDNDLIPDQWELAKANNLADLTQSGDFDGDEISDAGEYLLSAGTYPDMDPTDADTDGDGLTDYDELNGAGVRPPTHPTVADTDGDGVCDFNEDNTGTYVSILKTGTNPTLANTDGDGVGDGAEILQHTNPASAESPAAPTITSGGNTSPSSYAANVSTTDLLQGLTGTNAVHSGWYSGNSASPTRLNDGLHGGYGTSPVEGAWSNPGSVITYTLPAGAGSGWDLTHITTIADWSGGGFGNQRYEVSIRRVGETIFNLLATVNYQPYAATGAGASKVQITHSIGKLASGVEQIRFTMLATNGNSGRAVYREFDVAGTGSVIAPTEILSLKAPTDGNARATITWSSYPLKTYQVEISQNLRQWSILEPAFPSGGVTTTFRKAATAIVAENEFYRVSPNP